MLVYILMIIISCFGGFLADKVVTKHSKLIAFMIAFVPVF